MKKKAIFLDRDGTLIKEKHYLHKPQDIELEDNCLEALETLKNAGYIFVVITNQAGIAKGIFTIEDHEKTKVHLLETLKGKGVEIEKYYFCPYHPEAVLPEYKLDSSDRKPNPGMLLQAINELDIDPKSSYMIGDKLIDIKAGQSLNIKSILVETGYGKKEKNSTNAITPDYIAKDLLAATKFIAL